MMTVYFTSTATLQNLNYQPDTEQTTADRIIGLGNQPTEKKSSFGLNFKTFKIKNYPNKLTPIKIKPIPTICTLLNF